MRVLRQFPPPPELRRGVEYLKWGRGRSLSLHPRKKARKKENKNQEREIDIIYIANGGSMDIRFANKCESIVEQRQDLTLLPN